MERGHRHHVQFPRKVHEAHPDTREIRRNPWLIPVITQLGHSALHNEVELVPALDRFTAGRVRRDFVPIKGDYIATMYELMHSIEVAIKYPRSGDIARMNGEVAVYALEQQIPFIREFLISDSGEV